MVASVIDLVMFIYITSLPVQKIMTMIFRLTKLLFLKKQLIVYLMTQNKNLKSKDYVFNINQLKPV